MSKLYKESGVDVAAGANFVEEIKPHVKSTHRPGVLSDVGGFAGLFTLTAGKWQNPVLVSGTDGVGTKLAIANMANKYDTIGIDLVAMCVNDIIVCGAEPLFFLDYLAVSSLSEVAATDIVKGIAAACKESGCALLGGETAEMPGLYRSGDFDVAGFAVGIVERDEVIDRSGVRVGDVLIGLGSSGLHSNGFSLVRKVLFEDQGFDADTVLPDMDQPLSHVLLTPTQLYVKAVQTLIKQVEIHAMVHITGGGFWENIPRSLPDNVVAEIHASSWPKLHIFQQLQRLGNIPDEEMYAVFNCGIGYVMIVPQEQADRTVDMLRSLDVPAWAIGEVRSRKKQESQVKIEF